MLLQMKNLADPTNMGLLAKLQDHYTTAIIGMGTIDASGLEDITSTAKRTEDEVEAKYGQDQRDNPIDKKPPLCNPDSAVTHQASPIVAPQVMTQAWFTYIWW